MEQFKKIETGIEGLFLIECLSFSDTRGDFMEVYRTSILQTFGIEKPWLQMNQSTSKRGVLRGLHFQEGKPQAKLLRVLSGAIYDVVLDLRKDSTSYGKYYAMLLRSTDNRLLYIPEGFAHGFLALEEETKLEYFCSDYYHPEAEKGIFWKDSFLKIPWNLEAFGLEEKDLILSEKDKQHPSFLSYQREQEEAKVLLLGAGGQLGKAFQALFGNKHIPYLALTKEDLDIREKSQAKSYLEKEKWKAVINCAAYNAVDQAEIEKEECEETNAKAVKFWIELCQERGIPFLTFSTDFVFDGEKDIPYREEDVTGALSFYGRSKERAERYALAYEKALVIRASWLFGEGGNFCRQVLDLAKTREELHIVDDQISSPTYSKDLAKYSWALLEQSLYGLYHMSSEGEASKYDLAAYLLEQIQWKGRLVRAQSKDFPSLAIRPRYSKLSSKKIEKSLGLDMPHWKEAVLEYLKALGVIL